MKLCRGAYGWNVKRPRSVFHSLSKNTVPFVPMDETVSPGHIATTRTPVLLKCGDIWNTHGHTADMSCYAEMVFRITHSLDLTTRTAFKANVESHFPPNYTGSRFVLHEWTHNTVNTSTNKCTQQNTIHDNYQTATCFGTAVDPQGVGWNKEIQVQHAELGSPSPSLDCLKYYRSKIFKVDKPKIIKLQSCDIELCESEPFQIHAHGPLCSV